MLKKESVIWATHFLHDHSDGDLFPRVLEFGALVETIDELADFVSSKDLASVAIGASIRFIVPKDEISYRQATHLILKTV